MEWRSCDSSRPLTWEKKAQLFIVSSFAAIWKVACDQCFGIFLPASPQTTWWCIVEMSRTIKCQPEPPTPSHSFWSSSRAAELFCSMWLAQFMKYCETERDRKENCFPPLYLLPLPLFAQTLLTPKNPSTHRLSSINSANEKEWNSSEK